MKTCCKRMNLFVEDEEWKTFSGACRKNGETMTKVFYRAMREYVKYGKESGSRNRECLKMWLEGVNSGKIVADRALIDFTISCLGGK